MTGSWNDTPCCSRSGIKFLLKTFFHLLASWIHFKLDVLFAHSDLPNEKQLACKHSHVTVPFRRWRAKRRAGEDGGRSRKQGCVPSPRTWSRRRSRGPPTWRPAGRPTCRSCTLSGSGGWRSRVQQAHPPAGAAHCQVVEGGGASHCQERSRGQGGVHSQVVEGGGAGSSRQTHLQELHTVR
jgi:hypothetical protein